MKRNAEPAAIVRGLADTTARIDAVAGRLSAAQLVASPAGGRWSPDEILWHIRATADVHSEHIMRTLNENEPRWRHVSPRARMKKSRYDQMPFAKSFTAFKEQRSALVALLEGVGAEAWERVAIVRVPYNDSEWRPTVRELASGMVDHEAGHCVQMEAVAAALR